MNMNDLFSFEQNTFAYRNILPQKWQNFETTYHLLILKLQLLMFILKKSLFYKFSGVTLTVTPLEPRNSVLQNSGKPRISAQFSNDQIFTI